jgi:hypothetical protein
MPQEPRKKAGGIGSWNRWNRMTFRDSIMRLVIFLFILTLPFSAWAAEAHKKTPLQILDDKTAEIMEGLDQNQALQFEAIRGSHGIIRAVENVQITVEKASQACAQKNPDLARDLTSRFQDWRLALRPVLQKGRTRLEKMILLQNFAKPSEVRQYLGVFDAAVRFRDQGIVTTPVTSLDECKKFLKTMDQTQEDLIKLLNENLGLDQDLQIKDS